MFLPKYKDTQKPRGFTFCQYRRKEDAADAVKGMDGRVGALWFTLAVESPVANSTPTRITNVALIYQLPIQSFSQYCQSV